MRNRRILFFFLLFPFGLSAQTQERIHVTIGRLTAVTPPLRNWQPDPHEMSGKVPMRDQRGLLFARDLQPLILSNYGSRQHGEDPLLQKGFGKIKSPGLTNQAYGRQVSPPLAIERDGGSVGSDINGIPYTNLSPADPTLAVGPNHIIQMVNGPGGSSQFRVFDKTGTPLTAQAAMEQLPGASYNGAGDCVAWYDQLADRFVMSEFGDSSRTGGSINSLIIAVSVNNDPTGSWYVYEFSDATFFPDYPKFGNWPDAWYGVTRDFLGSTAGYSGNSVWAFNKAKMIAGDPTAEVQRVRLSDPDVKYNSLCPVSMAGMTPPAAGTPGMFIYYNDNDYTSSPTDADSLGIITFHVDFLAPSKSVVKVLRNMEVAPFKSNVCPSRNCAPSPSGNTYDVISDRIMNKPWYRNFGSHEDIVINHTVDADGNGLSALRWYLLRKSGTSWDVNQQGTFSPQENTNCFASSPIHRFMGSVSINGAGQIALAYNSSGLTRNASIGFTGRNDGDPNNLMTYAETNPVIGTAYGTFNSRWGDYSDLQPDVADDSLFWFTAMYGAGDTKWDTRILSFRLLPNLNLDARLVSVNHPTECKNPCTQDVRPDITIRNLGNATLHDLDVLLSVNGSAPVVSHWTGSLAISNEVNYTLPSFTLPLGTDTLRIFLANPNGGSDQNTSNDTLSVILTIGASAILPLQEGFENLAFPSPTWTLVSSGTPTYHWNRSTLAAHSGQASIMVDNYQTNEPGQVTDLRTPVMDISLADSADLAFYYAAGLVSAGKLDTLEVLASSDCGNSFRSIWKKWGTELATRNGVSANPFLPTAQEWRKVTLDLSTFIRSEKIILAFRNTNQFGNNIWLDDIQVESIPFTGNDAHPLALVSPPDITCTEDLKPELRFVNMGKDTLKSLDISYQVDGGPVLFTHWTGNLERLAGATVPLSPSKFFATGAHKVVFLTSLPNGIPDEHPADDTLKTTIYRQPIRPLPETEGFESGVPPPGWAEVHDPRITGWESYNGFSPLGGLSAYMKNYRNAASDAKASLITPIYQFSEADSVIFDFNLAAATYSYPGSTNIPLDTLEVFVSTDCGASYTSVYKKWGAELQTLGDPSQPYAAYYFPSPSDDWRLEHVNLTDALGGAHEFIVKVQCTSNHENNLYIDNAHVYTIELPSRLKESGYLVNPNPFRDKFLLRFHPDASKVIGWELFSSSGQMVKKGFYGAGNAPASQLISTGNLPSGVYALRIRLTDKTVTLKVVKL
jgi:hypothetical protein